MQSVTLCFLIRDNHICLAMKKRGFGKGKWNGVGGKVKDGETIEESVIREINEEIGVRVEPRHLEGVGTIEFYFLDNPAWNQRMHIFLARAWEGEPTESEEMAPQWYKKDALPLDSMWIDDPYWLPRVLAGKKIEGAFYFKNNGSEIEKFEVNEI